MKTLSLLAAFSLAAFSFGQAADPENNQGSLFPKNGRSYIEARTALRKGDLLTIVIDERFDGNANATTTATKRDTNAVGRADIPIIKDVLKWLRIPSFGILANQNTSADSNVAGAGATTTQNRLSGRLAVTVIEVEPNGNLVVEGSKTIRLNKERVTFTVSGVVRRDDVRPDNTVLSENVVNAEISASGRGLIADRQRRGILTRVMEWLF